MKTFKQHMSGKSKGYVSPISRIEKALGKKLSSTDEFHKKMKDLDDQYEKIKKDDKL